MRARFLHAIRPNAGTEAPRYFLFYDCEAHMLPQVDGSTTLPFRLLTALYWRRRDSEHAERVKRYTLTDRELFGDLLETVNPIHGKLIVCAFNLNADYIMANVHPMLRARGWVCELPYVKGRVKLCRLRLPTETYAAWRSLPEPKDPYKGRKWDRTIQFVDLANYYDGNLAEIGLSVGEPKMEVDLKGATTEELIPYCRQDTEIVYRAYRELLEWWISEGLGMWHNTAAGLSMAAYRHGFMPPTKGDAKHPTSSSPRTAAQRSAFTVYPHDNTRALALEYRAYHGGRCEAFQLERQEAGPYYHLDINAAYAHEMSRQVYPYKLVSYNPHGTIPLLKQRLERHCVVADVELYAVHAVYPSSVNGHTAYPLGRFTTSLTTRLLQEALEHNEILAVGAMAWYERGNLFSAFVDYVIAQETACKARIAECEELEQQGLLPPETRPSYQHARLYRLFWKKIRNSLYGKWAQRETLSELLGPVDPIAPKIEHIYDHETHTLSRVQYLAGEMWSVRQGDASMESFPAISAHITDDVRLYLWRLMSQAGLANVYNCDTDGFWANATGYARLQEHLASTALGGLKVEHTSPWLQVRGRKWYEYEGQWVCKGASHSGVWTDAHTITQEQWPSLLTSLSSPYPDTVHVKRITKHMSDKVYGGRPTPSGRVRPFFLPGDKYEGIVLYQRWRALIDLVQKAHVGLHLPEHLVRAWYDFDQDTIRLNGARRTAHKGITMTPLPPEALARGYTEWPSLEQAICADATCLLAGARAKREAKVIESLLPPELLSRIAEVHTEIEVLRSVQPLIQNDMFALWDYRQGAPRTGRNARGESVPVEYSRADSQATELGYPDLEALLQAVEGQAQDQAHITDLQRELQGLISETRYRTPATSLIDAGAWTLRRHTPQSQRVKPETAPLRAG